MNRFYSVCLIDLGFIFALLLASLGIAVEKHYMTPGITVSKSMFRFTTVT